MLALAAAMWAALLLLVWTHAGYPVFIALLARLRPRPYATSEAAPVTTLIVTAFNEEAVIAATLDRLLALDYPRDRLRIVVASDGSTDATHAIVESYADRGVELVACPRGGKMNTQNRAVRGLAPEVEVVAFADANSRWEPDALRLITRPFADPRIAYVCGRLRLESAEGANQEGLYWRYELWLRLQESRACSITAGNGAVYAVRRSAYIEIDPVWGHDLGLPFRLARQGLRSIYVPQAVASERAAAGMSDEFGRKTRMFGQSWLHVLKGGMFSLRRMGLLYWLEMISHRLLRYASGVLHVVLLAASAALALQGSAPATVILVAQLALLAAAGLSTLTRGRPRLVAVAQYYVVITAATLVGLWRALSGGVRPTWEKAAGTR